MAFFMALGAYGVIGSLLEKTLPRETMAKGDPAHIYLNGRYNRTATLTHVGVDRLYIYDNKIALPLDYRGRFYGMGIDPTDGSCFVYLAKRKHWRLIRIAELIRKAFDLVEDESNLNPDYSDDERLTKDCKAEEGVEDEM